MYPPPQEDGAIESSSRPLSGEHGIKLGLDFIRSQMKQNSHPPPFSYEYVLEDGKMPKLAEFHAVQRQSTAQVLRSSSTRSALRPPRRPAPINRSSSYNSPEISSTIFRPSSSHESTTDKLKRAFSLSSGRNSAQSSRQPSIASRREQTNTGNPQSSRHGSQSIRRPKTNLTINGNNARFSTPPSASRVPSLILPTPTPSPEPVHSVSSSPQKPPMTFDIPNHDVKTTERPFSWAYDDDVEGIDDELDDLVFFQTNGMGRMNTNFRPPRQFRKEKAFELLGITSKGSGKIHTPALSAATSLRASPATSDRDHLSRNSSRRISLENRYSESSQGHSKAAEIVGSQSRHTGTPTRNPTTSTAEEETPRPKRQLNYQELFNPVSSPSSTKFVKKPVPVSKPTPITVPKFPSPPVVESRSAPPFLASKTDSPLHSAKDSQIVLAEPQPLPVSVAKVSRFIEHLDANSKRLSLPITKASSTAPRAAFLEIRPLSDEDAIAPAPRRATSPLPAALREAPISVVPQVVVTQAGRASIDLGASNTSVHQQGDISGVRRSASMRESTSGPWGAVLCTAQARPIVAAGQAKMV